MKALRSWSTTEIRTPISRAEMAIEWWDSVMSSPIGKSNKRIYMEFCWNDCVGFCDGVTNCDIYFGEEEL